MVHFWHTRNNGKLKIPLWSRLFCKKGRPCLQNNQRGRKKRPRGVAQAVNLLPRKKEFLSSNPSTGKGEKGLVKPCYITICLRQKQ
jgi:hypothetical protein